MSNPKQTFEGTTNPGFDADAEPFTSIELDPEIKHEANRKETDTSQTHGYKKCKSRHVVIIVLVVLLALALVGVGIYFGVKNGKNIYSVNIDGFLWHKGNRIHKCPSKTYFLFYMFQNP
jgi:hypothetical protein